MLVECEYADVAKFKSAAARDHVSVSPTKKTRWFKLPTGEGFCGLIEVGAAVRIKGVYVHREYRGSGIGTKMTEELLTLAEREGKPIEVLAYNAKFYEDRGFKKSKQLPNGAWRLAR